MRDNIRGLLGRRQEQQLLAGLLGGAREGHSGVLVVRGEPGIGKTALIDHLLEQASDFRVIRSSGAESEMELVHAGVQQVCAPLRELLSRLPKPQRLALEVALGVSEGDGAPDRLLVGLALLTLLAEVGASRPTICVVDDAHWVDRASLQAIAFAARRLLADRVVVIFAARTPVAELADLPEMVLEGLSDSDARALLAALLPGRISDRMRDSIVAESRGNPLALLELHRSLDPTDLAGGYGLAHGKSIPGRIEHSFIEQFNQLPAPTRMLCLIAAAEPTGQPSWLWSAAARLGIGVEAAAPAETAGLLSVDGRILFRHPLVRSAIYRHAPLAERRQAHEALAVAISDAPDHRAWHRAHSIAAPDDAVANELLAVAEQARARGGIAAAAAFLAAAVDATPDRPQRVQLALQAAQAKLDAGSLDAAARLLDLASEVSDDESISVRADLIRAKLAWAARRGPDAPPLLLAAAQRLARIDPALARDTYLEALMSTLIVGRFFDPESPPELVARAARPVLGTSRRDTVDLLMEGLIIRLTDGYIAAAPLLRNAIAEYVRETRSGTSDPRWHDVTNRICLDLFEQDAYDFLTSQQVEMQRATGELTLIASSLSTYAGLCVTRGDFAAAEATLQEVEILATATGTPPHLSIVPYLAAYRGEEKHCLESARVIIEGASDRGEGTEVSVTRYAVAVLHNGLSQYPKALAAARAGLEHDDVGMSSYLLTEAVEAAAYCGETDLAKELFARINERAQASGAETALGIAARSRALVGVSADPGADYQAAVEHLSRTPVVVYQARTHLVYGEWLRRANRRADARTQLRRAYDLFAQMGAAGFAARARRELQAAGEAVHKPVKGTAIGLTTQERQITRLARQGCTNSEIGAQLFISPRTVEWHLGRIFAKLGVSSRRELRNLGLEMLE
ncbi:helix-turn-helix transcriptional regulator [Mycobacterium asiaticum]|uniref:helix-turn-helix transcriptional regulator n=1 Tax=Mycobacterium asiaticum TaxID=1790 RepID=UPI0009BD855B|nr:LuxR family transcriptional regulator [Mycobacterium asiaticum]